MMLSLDEDENINMILQFIDLLWHDKVCQSNQERLFFSAPYIYILLYCSIIMCLLTVCLYLVITRREQLAPHTGVAANAENWSVREYGFNNVG